MSRSLIDSGCQNGSKMPPKWIPKRSQDSPKMFQDAPGHSQHAPKTSQDGVREPKLLRRPIWEPKCLQNGQIWDPEWIQNDLIWDPKWIHLHLPGTLRRSLKIAIDVLSILCPKIDKMNADKINPGKINPDKINPDKNSPD